MTSTAILPAGIIPGLSANARSRLNGHQLSKICGQEICIGVVRPPLIRHSINAAGGVTDNETGLDPASLVRVHFISGEFEMLYKNSSPGKTPFTGRDKINLLN